MSVTLFYSFFPIFTDWEWKWLREITVIWSRNWIKWLTRWIAWSKNTSRWDEWCWLRPYETLEMACSSLLFKYLSADIANNMKVVYYRVKNNEKYWISKNGVDTLLQISNETLLSWHRLVAVQFHQRSQQRHPIKHWEVRATVAKPPNRSGYIPMQLQSYNSRLLKCWNGWSMILI